MQKLLAIVACLLLTSCVSNPKKPKEIKEITIQKEADDLLTLINQERAKKGLKNIAYHAALACAAEGHALDIASRRACTHYGKDGSSFVTRAKRCGFNLTRGGEIVACGQKKPKEAVNAWLKSSGHNAIMMDPSQKYFGAGYKDNYWVVVFSKN